MKRQFENFLQNLQLYGTLFIMFRIFSKIFLWLKFNPALMQLKPVLLKVADIEGLEISREFQQALIVLLLVPQQDENQTRSEI